MHNEVEDTIRIGIEGIIMSVLASLIVVIVLFSYDLFTRADDTKYIRQSVEEKADTYIFESGQNVSGTDIMDFILKYDAKFDYYINIGAHTYAITQERDTAYAVSSGLKEGGYLYSTDYLMNTVFNSTNNSYLDTEFSVDIEYDAATREINSYKFTKV